MPGRERSVGIVTPQTFKSEDDFVLDNGSVLPGIELVYETYGRLNDNKSNALLICHALSGDHHAAGFHTPNPDERPGWWESAIGPGKPFDSDKFFIVSLNNLGGCSGSTGPASVDPRTGELYGEHFPQVTVGDWVRSQVLLAEHLEIERFAAVIGGSLGGMQALQWAIDYPDQIGHALLIACASWLSTENLAFNHIARVTIQSDPEHGGMGIARMIGHVTYLSGVGLEEKFGRKLQEGHEREGLLQIESYLDYQAEKFIERFNPHTYILMTKALDTFDPTIDFQNDLIAMFKQTLARFLVVSFTSDWRFSPARSEELVDAMVAAGRDVTYANIESIEGHDSFLLDAGRIPRYHAVLSAYMNQLYESDV